MGQLRQRRMEETEAKSWKMLRSFEREKERKRKDLSPMEEEEERLKRKHDIEEKQKCQIFARSRRTNRSPGEVVREEKRTEMRANVGMTFRLLLAKQK